jgi:hypothetical protein
LLVFIQRPKNPLSAAMVSPAYNGSQGPLVPCAAVLLSGTFTIMEPDNAENMHDSEDEDDDLIVSITPDVMACLVARKFFEELDNRLCPPDTSAPRASCHGDYAISKLILRACGFDDAEIADIFGVLRAQGGFCDCEVLHNVAETSRLKAEHWRAVAAGLEPPTIHNSKS